MSKAKRLVGIVFAVLFAVSAFGCLARTTPAPLQAGARTQQSGAALQNGTALAAADDELSAYLFVYFIGDGYNNGYNEEQVYFSVSRTGFEWESLNNGNPILISDVGEHGVRDPHIIRKSSGQGFYIIATDLSIGHGHDYVSRPSGWGASQTAGSRAIIVWESDDLVTWTDARRCEIARENATNTWAPESIWDAEKQQYMVFWSSKTSEDWKYRLYRCYTSDYVTFSEPEVYIEFDDPYIDATFIKEGEWYYRFTKNENTKHVIMEKSKSLSGPFLAVDTYTINGAPGIEETRRVGYEGPTGFKMNGQEKWMLLLDGLNENQGYKPFVTDNLDAGTFVSATAFDFGGVDFRHGSCIPITGKEYNALLKKYNKEPDPGEGNLVFSLDFEDNLDAGGTKGGATANGTISYEKGYKGKAAKVSGNGNYIEITGGANNPLAGLDEATISFALNLSAKTWPFWAAATDKSFGDDDYQHEQYLGIIWGDNGSSNISVQRWYNEGSRAATADASLTSGEWYHITISFYEGNTVLYVNGQRKGTAPANKTLSQILGSSPIAQIGKGNWKTGEYGNMLIDSFKIYNYAMNREQVAAHYAAEKA